MECKDSKESSSNENNGWCLGDPNHREMVDLPRLNELILSTPIVLPVERVSLRNKSYASCAAAQLQEVLSSSLPPASITTLDLADIIAGRPEDEALQVLKHICDGLASQASTVVELNLSDNALGEKGVRACAGVWSACHNLERLYFCNNGISADCAAVIASEVVLWRGKDVPTKLSTFHFYNNMSGSGGAIALAAVVASSPLLTNLRFSATRAGREGCTVFATAMQSLTTLVHIDVSDNTFGEEGAEPLAVAIAAQPLLETLNLRDTSLGDVGMEFIANALLQRDDCLMIESLDISGNELTPESVPSIVKLLLKLPHLKTLMMEENELTSAGAILLAQALERMPQLETLGLSVNEIGSAGALAIVNAMLRPGHVISKLELDGNEISKAAVEKISDLLADAEKLEILRSMEDNDDEADDEEEVEAIDTEISSLLEEFDSAVSIKGEAAVVTAVKRVFQFEANREVVDETRAKILLEPFQEVDTIFSKISISNKSYTRAGAAILANYLESTSGARILDLADMIAGRPEEEALHVLETICSSLSSSDIENDFEEIDLSDNALGEKGVRACFGVLLGNPNLKRLYFCNNGISAAAAAVIANEVVLSSNSSINTKLNVFHFYNNMSGDEGAVALSNVLPRSPDLEDLRFSATRAGRAGCSAFAKSLQSLRKLKHLDLSDNTFGTEGSEMLAIALRNQSQLKTLNLRDAGLEDEGCEAVLEAISASCPELVSLDISGNELTSDSVASICSFLKSAKNLTHLFMEENEFGDVGAIELAAGLASGAPSLQTLVMNMNEIETEGAVKITAAVAEKEALASLELNANTISSEGISEIQEILKKSEKLQVLGTLEDNEE